MNRHALAGCAIAAGIVCTCPAAVEVTNASATGDVGLHRVFTWTDTAAPGTLTVLDDAGRDVDVLVVGGGAAGGAWRNPNAQESHTLPVAGEDGLGGGGGGGLGYNWSTCGGANGGRGVVVLRFAKNTNGGFMLLVR